MTWTVSQDEYDTILRAAVLRTFFTVGLPGLLLVLVVAPVFGLLSGWPLAAFSAVPGLAVLGGALVAARSVRRMFGAAFPVGATITTEATDAAFVMRTASGAMELPWSRIGRHRVGPVLIVAKDRVSRHSMLIPRVLFPDEWLPRLDPTDP
ncbi:hypothetical protein [Nocardioides sp. WS12]|uniref:hypothetical protein n=1 Tax=Nocardioides sp. WS12 TaxID=2486272 RepID=UPI0015FC9B2A|nr:hypothetical protein [Nocardioides sp. WS12]